MCGGHKNRHGVVLHFISVENISIHCGLYVLVSQPFHHRFGLGSVLGQDGPVRVPEAVTMEIRIPKLFMDDTGAVFE